MAYFDKFARWPKKSLLIYARYDLTFLPELSRQAEAGFRKYGTDLKTVILPCGHYTTGETPFKYMDGYHMVRFLVKNL
jgi:pimeloyl-ACP methyl ester carboxylesterase